MTDAPWTPPLSPAELLVVCDLDGTLLDAEANVTPRTARAAEAFVAAGGRLSVATARSRTSSLRFLEALPLVLPVVLFNGALLVDPRTLQPRICRTLDPAGVGEWLAAVERAGQNAFLHAITDDGQELVFYRAITNASERHFVDDRLRRGDPRFRHVEDFDEALRLRLIEIMVVGRREQTEPLRAQLAGDARLRLYHAKDHYVPDYHWLELVHPLATKAAGVEAVAAVAGAGRQLLCIGDAPNDLPMLALADIAVAVANADEQVKQAADAVIGHHDQEAVAALLERLVARASR